MIRGTGSLVGDLKHDDFIISENGVQQQIFFWQRRPLALSLLILVDASGLHKQLDAVRSSLMDSLKPGDEVSILQIAERPIVLLDYTGDKRSIDAALDRAGRRLSASSLAVEKSLPMALQEAAGRARVAPKPESLHGIILISDVPERTAVRTVLPEAVVRGVN